MWNPARFALDSPRVIVLATLLLLIYGVLSYQALPRQENPALEERFARVVTYLPGTEPEKVEFLVTQVLEDHIAEVDDIEDIFSTSSHGTSFVMAELEKGAPTAIRLQQIREKIQQARLAFPDGTSEPDVDTRVFRTNTVVLALTGPDIPALVLREQAKELKRSLENLSSVRRVEMRGLPEEEIEVALDLRRLSKHGLALGSVIEALAQRNVQLPSGELQVGIVHSGIQTSGAFETTEEIAGTFLGGGGLLPIRVGDVARVQRQLADPDVRVRHRGTPAVALGVEMLPERSAIRLGEQVSALVDRLRPSLPEGMSVEIVADEPTYVAERLGLLTQSLLIGLGLVVTLTLLGMGWRSGAVVSLTIPLALTVAMAAQGLAGIPLHQISIAALVIAIGIVVDEAIVVTDNIQRHLDRGLAPREAAIRGLAEIHLAVLAGAATTVAAFIPLMVMEGDVGDFIRSIPIVVSVMLVSSVAVAHFVTPLLAAFVHQWFGGSPKESRAQRHLGSRYEPVIGFAVRRPWVVVSGLGFALLGTSLLIAGALWPPVFFPDADRHQFMIKADLPSGSPLEETRSLIERVEARLAEDPDLRDWTSFVGSDVPKFYYNQLDEGRAENIARIVVNTNDDVAFEKTAEVAARIDADLKAWVPGALIRVRTLRQGYGGGADVEVFVMGDDLDVLRTISREIRDLVEDVPGATNARDSFGYDPVTIDARVDGPKAHLLGISHHDVATTLRSAVDGVVATTLREGDEEIDIRVRLERSQRANVSSLASLPLHSPTAGHAVPLAQVATLEVGWATRAILRYNRKREAYVRADLAPGASLLTVAADVERTVRERISLPPGYKALFFGQQEEVTESFLSLARAAVTAVFLIYIILVLRFQSLAQPALILLAVPMAMFGACVGLAVTGNALGFMAFLGMISLTGIAVNDSIVLVDTINRLRGEGMALEEAVRAGARTRLRAVVLTSITTMGGLIPLSVGGGVFWAPFGFVMIFGLGASTVLTLGIQPAAYLLLARAQAR